MRSIIAAVLFMLSAAAHSAWVTADFSHSSGYGGIGYQDTGYFGLGYYDSLNGVADVMWNVAVTSSDVGQTFSLTPGSNGFYLLSQNLTNGIDEDLAYGDGEANASDLYFHDMESDLFGTNPDFSGLTITNIDLIINNITFDQYLNGQGNEWTDVFYDVTYVVTATTVPIPAAAWLFGSALAGLGWLRRKQTV